MLSKKMPVVKYELTEYWLDIGRLSDYEEAHKIVKEYFNNG
jgi:NDP-sugar pyrophosphorylase family protein